MEYILTLVIFASICAIHGAKFPSDITLCKRSDPDLDKCLITAFEKFRPYMAKGYPDLHLPPLEPFVISELNINHQAEPLTLNAKFTNIMAYGGTNYKVENLKVDVPALTMDLKLSLPELYVTNDYEFKGSIFAVSLNGTGKSIGNYSDVAVDLHVTFKTEQTKGVDHLKVDNVSAKIKIGGMKINLIDAANPDAASPLSFLENTEGLSEMLQPILDDTANSLISTFFDQVLSKISIDELLPN